MANGFSDIKTDIVPLAGGLDLVTTPVMVPPGRLISSNNFEPDINGGYKRIPGIERYDGHTSPHDGDYYIADVVISGIIAIGDTITGATSGATAKVLLVIDSTHLLVNKVIGTFVSESFTISAVLQELQVLVELQEQVVHHKPQELAVVQVQTELVVQKAYRDWETDRKSVV